MAASEGSPLAKALRDERKRQRLSLRDLSDLIGVSSNTLSRVERGFLPDLKNFDAINRWLSEPATAILPTEEPPDTKDIIAKHLFADTRLERSAAAQIADIVQELYDRLAAPQPLLKVHLRSAQTFKPAVGPLLASALSEMFTKLEAENKTQ